MTELVDDLPPRELAELRLRAEQLVRDGEDRPLLELVRELRTDEQWWVHLWAPAVAVAARRLGAPNAIALLEEAVAAGLSQPELFEGELEKLFGADAAWPSLRERMRANVPQPLVELTDWPEPGPALPVELYTIAPDRLAPLLARLPRPSPSAWETARRMLAWVHAQWDHANDHVEDPDALNVLERVEAGARFACAEYSIVLSQALNAVRIPSRRVDLRQADHHVGVGRGHVVSEAWIDDLDRWVLLDGQNGSYWVDAGGHPLGVRELQRSAEVPAFVGAGDVEPLTNAQAAGWFSYFASASTTGYTWSEGSFAPVFQEQRTIRTPRLLRDGDLAYPRLSAITTGIGGRGTNPTVRFTHAHPYGTGIRLGPDLLHDGEWPLDLTPGVHELTATIVTPYGETAPQRFSYVSRSSGR
ncbi:hypothetical protein GCM10009789_17900 [Kribbella sancticallisti]|uniref:Transglutaminase-like domain-containing protein n=1 Tax=Kribbella sancticallisti TaxID=460087 RepID=A0ABN2CWV5_9ACTN